MQDAQPQAAETSCTCFDPRRRRCRINFQGSSGEITLPGETMQCLVCIRRQRGLKAPSFYQ